ncbi:hypothetical protein [Candidatus Protochlamydia phocaeensis]|uniref:hypothetical protein n=1 Tax=Candidatus Protochlamydia phocaeensis TaxID=1414722 RepID=UPI000838EA6F|nr:hypothetical protein [Candidatus Protochlamydia phocaeensis]
MKIFYTGFLCCSLNFTNLIGSEDFDAKYQEIFDLSAEKLCILKSIDNLDKAINLCSDIQDIENQQAVFSRLSFCFQGLKSAFWAADYEKAKQIVLTLNENLGEILADCIESKRDEITAAVNAMMAAIETDNEERS